MKKIIYYENVLEFKDNTKSSLLLSECKDLQFCRTCLEDDANDTTDIQNLSVYVDGELLNVKNMLLEISGIEVFQNKWTPIKICKECVNKIFTFYMFKSQMKRASDVLERMMNKIMETDSVGIQDIDIQTIQDADTECTSTNKLDEINSADIVKGEDVSSIIEKEIDIEGEQSEVLIVEELESTMLTQLNTDTNETVDEMENANETLIYYEDLSQDVHSESTEDISVSNLSDEKDEFIIEIDNDYKANSDEKSYSVRYFQKNEDRKNKSETENNLLLNGQTENYNTTKNKKEKHSNMLLRNLTCDLCGQTFSVQKSLILHVQQEHPNEKAFKCRQCDAKFTHLQSLSRHMHQHKPQINKNVCPQCGKIFLRSDDLKRHVRIHTGDRPYECSICDKSFKQNGELKDHQITHLKEKYYKCDECNHSFASRNGLYVHKKAHDGKRNFHCSYCDRRFLTSGELKSHSNVHYKKMKTEEVFVSVPVNEDTF